MKKAAESVNSEFPTKHQFSEKGRQWLGAVVLGLDMLDVETLVTPLANIYHAQTTCSFPCPETEKPSI